MTEMFYLFVKCFSKKYFQFSGRASRKEYISFILFYSLINLTVKILFFVTNQEFLSAFVFCSILFFTIPSITLTVRRLHDFNFSGYWNFIIIFILCLNEYEYKNIGVIIGFLFGSILIFIKSTLGPNRYGEEPK